MSDMKKRHGLHLPLCPYCSGRFLYGDVRRNLMKKTGTCPQCGKTFLIRAKSRIVLLWCIAGILLCMMNLMFWSLEKINFLFIVSFTAVLLCCLFPLHPFVVRYKAIAEKEHNRPERSARKTDKIRNYKRKSG